MNEIPWSWNRTACSLVLKDEDFQVERSVVIGRDCTDDNPIKLMDG
jgi:hypothetical protein